MRANFTAWDLDHNGELSTEEIEKALDDPTVKGPAAAAAATLRRSIYAYKIKPVTLDSLAALVNGSHDATPKPPPFEGMYDAALKKIEAAHREIFFSGEPKVETLGQGRLGDCFLLASVGSVTGRDPDRMKSMVSQSGDNVSVRFGNGQTVTLPAPTDGEVVIGSSTLNDGVWGNVFEKAIGHLLLERQKTPGKFVTPYEIIGVGGTPNVPLSILTGHKCKRFGCEDFQKPDKLSPADHDAKLEAMRDALETAFKTGKMVVGGTGDISGPERKVPGLFYDHSYGVLGYDRKTDIVTFWNPMGGAFRPKGSANLENGYPTSHGRFDCPLTDTVMWFGSFSIETDEPVDK